MELKIVLPTDFSKNAWNAITYAADLFKEKEVRFYILNTYEIKGIALDGMLLPSYADKALEEAKKASSDGLEKVLQMLSFRNNNHKHSFVTLSQNKELLSGLKDIVEKQDIDMVIMGTKGRTNARELAFGSNTTTIMEKLRNCPVMGVPLEARFAVLNEIVFPTSYKTHFKRRELQYLIDIAQLKDANIAVVHIDQSDMLSELQLNNKALLSSCFEKVSHSFHRLSGSDPSEGVQHFVESRNSDMIAFINKKHFLFDSVFSNPMVKKIGMYARVPVLALHDLRN